MRVTLRLIKGLQYKLRMMEIVIEEPMSVFRDNQAVVRNTTAPESTLKKKHVALNYHCICEAVAAGTIWITMEDTATNLADILTKCLKGPRKRALVGRILW
jgi:hypothetical protein